MESTTAGALRAHLVLLSAAISAVSAAAIVLIATLHLPVDDPGLETRALMFVTALLLLLYLWNRARQAFRAALNSNQIALSAAAPNGVSIEQRCSNASLVSVAAKP